ncbi:glycosyltransferase family 50 protein [Atractiella rhizophila]|nr:glycosyltransferase family 50 protein [Atractiella rhizophila]
MAISWFLQTFVFVTFNKVCTSQYFIWYILFLPFVLLNSRVPLLRWLPLLVVWVATQALWLSIAYQLEIKARPLFLELWLASLVHFGGNEWTLRE